MSRFRPVYRVVLIALALAPIGWAIYRQWPGFQSSLSKLAWGQFLSAQLLLFAILPLWAAASWATLRNSVGPFSYVKAAALFFASQAVKYLPGGVWALPGRMLAYQSAGVDRVQSVLIVFRELSAFFLGGAAVGILGYLQAVRPGGAVLLAILAGILGCVVFIVMLHQEWTWKRLVSLRGLKISPEEIQEMYLRLSWLPPAFLASAGFWLLIGIPFRQLALSISPEAAALSVVEAASIFALAWCAGFVVVFVPAGLGVREGALTVLLSAVVPLGDALGIAVLARLWWLLGEALWIVLGVAWVSGSSELSLSRLRGVDAEKTPASSPEIASHPGGRHNLS